MVHYNLLYYKKVESNNAIVMKLLNIICCFSKRVKEKGHNPSIHNSGIKNVDVAHVTDATDVADVDDTYVMDVMNKHSSSILTDTLFSCMNTNEERFAPFRRQDCTITSSTIERVCNLESNRTSRTRVRRLSSIRKFRSASVTEPSLLSIWSCKFSPDTISENYPRTQAFLRMLLTTHDFDELYTLPRE